MNASTRWVAALAVVGLGACGPEAAVPGHGGSAGGTTTGASTSTSRPTGTSSSSSTTGVSSTTGTSDDSTTNDTCGWCFCAQDEPDYLAHCSPPDGGTTPIECDVWAQDCPPGEKCMPWANDGGPSWNATRCTPVAPNPKTPGQPCTVEGNHVSGVDDCEPGSMCWNVDPATNQGICVDFCTGSELDPVCEDLTTECMLYGEGVLILCLPPCSPLEQDCPGDEACVFYPTTGGFICTVDDPVPGKVGEPCEYADGCDPGLLCGTSNQLADCVGSAGCCTPYCDVTDPNASAACPGAPQEACVPWFEEGTAPAGLEHLGVCLLPP